MRKLIYSCPKCHSSNPSNTMTRCQDCLYVGEMFVDYFHSMLASNTLIKKRTAVDLTVYLDGEYTSEQACAIIKDALQIKADIQVRKVEVEGVL